MSLKNKIIILLLCIFGGYAIVEHTVQRFILLPAFVQLELTAASGNTHRSIQALEREVELLIPSATDWATWDDTYRFMVDRNAEYAESNLNVKALESLNVNLMGFYDLKGQKVWGMAYDHENEKAMALGELSENNLKQASSLLGVPGGMNTVSGLYRTSAGIFLIASRPILTSNGDGPSRGRIVLGRLLDKAAVDRLGVQARVQLHVDHLTAAASQPANHRENHEGIAHTPIVLTESDAITSGTADVLDINGMPVLRFHVDTPRTIVAQGRTTLRYASLSLAIAGTLVLLVLLVFLRRTVLDPIALLTRHAIAVGTHDDLHSRLKIQRKDEIGTLAEEFDIMVGRLSETRRRLLDQSYNAGIAEMASGALHNIGNAITPIGVKLITLRRDLKQAPVAEMAKAGKELADPATPADRKAALGRFSELAGAELATMLTRAADELETIRSQVDHVQMILTDQQRFSRAERLVEALAPHHLLKETMKLLPEELCNNLHFEIDEGLARVGCVRFARIALQQIFTNLLINAAEAISAAAVQSHSGRIYIYPGALDTEHEGMAHICFEDNGVGISPGQLPHLFERGFSTKSRGSGIGLHWCANTVSAMGGRIYATSSGIGQGACLHLLLPFAHQTNMNMEHAV